MTLLSIDKKLNRLQKELTRAKEELLKLKIEEQSKSPKRKNNTALEWEKLRDEISDTVKEPISAVDEIKYQRGQK